MVAIELSGITYNYEGDITLENIQYFILTGFGLKQGEYTVVYVDEEGDHITLGTTDDYEIVSSVATQNLRLIVTPHKPVTVALETVAEILVPLEEFKIQEERKALLQQEAEKKQADKRIKQDELAKKKADNQRKRIEKQAEKLEAERIKKQKHEAKKIAQQQKKIAEQQRKTVEQQKKVAQQEKKKQQQQLKEKAKAEAQNKKQQAKKEVSPVSLVQVIKQKKQVKDEKSKEKVNKKPKAVEKIGEWDIQKLNKHIDERLKKLSPAPVVQQIKQQSFNIGLQYPTTLQDVAKLKSEALQKLNAFYQAEHAKLAEKQKQQKAKIVALEKEKKKKLQKEAKQKEAKQKQAKLKQASNPVTQ